MTMYEVERRGEVREVYLVEADSAEDAKTNWMNGDLSVSDFVLGSPALSVIKGN